MGLRFQKRIRLLKGLTVNLSKTGISLSIGMRGATVNLGKHGNKTTVGLPGTGISYSEFHKNTDRHLESKENSSSQPANIQQDLNPAKSPSVPLPILIVIVIWVCYLAWKFFYQLNSFNF